MNSYHDTFKTYLVKIEGRYTDQKRAIVDEIFKTTKHFEVEAFLDRVRLRKGREFSRATVYRTIKQLFEAGLIQRITTPEGRVFYEHNFGKKQHDHIICNVCGKIFPIEEDIIHKQIEAYCKQIGFSPEYRSLHVYGKCKKCQEK